MRFPRTRGDRPRTSRRDTQQCPVPPQKRVIGATFLLRVPLPPKFNGKYDPAARTPSTPTLLKPGDRPRFTKAGKNKPGAEPKPGKAHKTQRVRNDKDPQATTVSAAASPSKRGEYERLRGQRPERKEAHRQAQAKRRQQAQELGLCRSCNAKAIPGQTRCETCAEKHRASRRIYDAKRRETAKQAADSDCKDSSPQLTEAP